MISNNSIFAKYPVVTALAFSFICLLPTMILRDFTPSNELRYLSIADEAVREGHIFAFTNHGLAYADKPPLYIWTIMLCKLIAGRHSMFLLSLFSMIPAMVIVCIMDRWTRFEDPGKRAASALMLMTSVLFLGMSVFLRMDMMMVMFIVLALHSFYLMYSGEGDSRRQGILLPVWIFMALFTKGPVGILMPPLVIICFLLARGKIREAGRYLGWKTWGIIAGLSAIWLLGVYFDGGKSYIENLLFHQTFGRAVNSFHHSEPFWYYLVCIWYVIAPYCFAAIGALIVSVAAFFRKKQITDRELLFSTAVVATTVMLSCFSGKLSIYIAPVIPFIIYLFPVVEERIGWKKWMGPSLCVPAGILAVAGLAIAAVVCLRPAKIMELIGDYEFAVNRLTFVAGLTLAAASIIGIVVIIRRRYWVKGVFYIATGMLLTVYCASMMMPQINDFVGYGNLCRYIPQDTEIVTLRVHRPENIDVYTGRQVVDYGRDSERFISERIDGFDGTPYTLLIREKTAYDYPQVMALIKANTSVKVGDFLEVDVEIVPEEIKSTYNGGENHTEVAP